jgi:PIN domain nuclease of toxin-antitoxin system
LALLIDTQALVWLGTGSKRMSRRAVDAITDPLNRCFISVVIACEFADLNRRGRFGGDLRLQDVLSAIEAEIIELPAPTWRLLEGLPPIHRDPIDRMLIAHALHANMTVVTADTTIRRYPVKTVW